MEPHRARILIAIGMKRAAIVLTTDSEWVESEIDGVGCAHCDDLGLLTGKEFDLAPGLYLWEGILKTVGHNTLDGWEPETEFVGAIRDVELREVKELLNMQAPRQELEKGQHDHASNHEADHETHDPDFAT